jgi:hypothetical protein
VGQIECVCGRRYYWPRQRWIHEGCVANAVANAVEAPKPETRTVRRDEPIELVRLVPGSRYKDKEKRRKYMAELMRKRRREGLAK